MSKPRLRLQIPTSQIPTKPLYNLRPREDDNGPVPTGAHARYPGDAPDPYGMASVYSLDAELAQMNEELGQFMPLMGTTDALQPPPNETPVNKALVDRATLYEKELVPLVRKNIAAAREFFLTEALPLLLSLDNGFRDGSDVAKIALKEEPDSAAYISWANRITNEALKAKTIHFIKGLAALSPEAESLFLSTYRQHVQGTTPKDAPNDFDLKAILREVLAVHDVRRPAKGRAKAPVRELQADEVKPQPSGPRKRGVGTARSRQRKP